MSSAVRVSAKSGLLSSSRVTISSGWPAIPPAAFISSTAILVPSSWSSAIQPYTPESPEMNPSTASSCRCILVRYTYSQQYHYMRTAHETPGEPTPTLTPQEWLVRLDKVSGAINFASRDLANTVDLLMERLRPTLKADAIVVWSIEPGTEFLQIDAQSGLSAQYVRFFNQSDRVKLGRGIVGKAMVERSAKTMESRDDPHMLEQARWREMLVEEGVHSIMCAPMFVESNIVGALCLYYRTPRAFTEEQRLFLQVLANQLAVTIENIRNYDVISADRENLEKQLAKLFNLQRITELLDVNIGTSLESSLKALLEYLQDSFRSDSLAIFQPRSDGEMDLTVEAGLPSVLRAHLLAYPIRIDDAFIGRCFASSKEVFTSRAMTA